MDDGFVDPAAGGPDSATVEAVHQVEQALEWMERAWGHLLACHHEVGHSQITMFDAADKLQAAGHHEPAQRLRTTVAVEERRTRTMDLPDGRRVQGTTPEVNTRP